MSLIVFFCVGLILALGLKRLTAQMLTHPELARSNYAGRTVYVSSGLGLVLCSLCALLIVQILHSFGAIELDAYEQVPGYMVGVLVFGLVGLVDDLLGDSASRGFSGHLGAFMRGTLTTGMLKLAIGGLAGLAVSVALQGGSASNSERILGGICIALCANLANLFDRAPGRLTKVVILCWLVFFLAGLLWANDRVSSAWPALLVTGVAVGFLPEDLHEKYMLGDTGANVLGAVGAMVVVALGNLPAMVIVAIVSLALNLLSERVSFSSIISSNRMLRAADAWGRRGA